MDLITCNGASKVMLLFANGGKPNGKRRQHTFAIADCTSEEVVGNEQEEVVGNEQEEVVGNEQEEAADDVDDEETVEETNDEEDEEHGKSTFVSRNFNALSCGNPRVNQGVAIHQMDFETTLGRCSLLLS
ncbi:hypothetical protein QVD17_06432 [Tagetes erecta]|uniref:Uncharacterized protein n=1 Tax=Tagetes erecta TaxID=13708 RepID=A0AAD8LJC6_TARER|nr:hypothetical protein QVD17_06432 [Tagetes erecta]